MRTYKIILSLVLTSLSVALFAHVPDYVKNAGKTKATYRAECTNSQASIDQDINNVRARLLAGGDVWWDFNDGRYIVPKVDPLSGEQEVSSIFAGSVWLGGVDPGGNLKLAAQDYRTGGANDFWPGPLSEEGITDKAICDNWDRHFRVYGSDVALHLSRYLSNPDGYTADQIPTSLKRWPALGNPFFLSEFNFPLPTTPQGLADFYDANEDGLYNPLDGDYPSIGIRGCPLDQYPDEMIFWIYNDQGGGATHAVTNGDAIQMEVQVQAFGYTTTDDLNSMTFQRYKLINRATEDIDSCFFAMWVDADLGCYSDDYIGCDSSKSLMYIYNQDPVDGQPGCECAGVPTYCNDVPLLGVDYFRGPLDTLGNEIGMSSFMYYNNPSVGSPNPNTTDPSQPIEFYRYLNGQWRDGTDLTYGGSGYQSGGPIVKYALPDRPSDPAGWSMCTANLPFGDRRTLQATGPFTLKPGAVNELIIGIPWVSVGEYNCPDMEQLFRADQLAQGLFDNCFRLLNGPDAPEVNWIEKDKEIVAVLTNNNLASNNYNELYGGSGIPCDRGNRYSECDFLAPDAIAPEDSEFEFEGYQVFQLTSPNVSDFNDPEQSRLVRIFDRKNGITKIYNWDELAVPNSTDVVYTPVLTAEGVDEGIRHSFSITEDAFSLSDNRSLINHKKYYFAVVAYGHNEYETFDPINRPVVGQQRPYLRGRRGPDGGAIERFTVIPRPTIDRVLSSTYGEGFPITRLEGVGNGGNFLELEDGMREAIIDGTANGILKYKEGAGPFSVQVFNPFEVKDGNFELVLYDQSPDNNNWDGTPVKWNLLSVDENGEVIELLATSEKSIDDLNEQIIAEFGISITVGQVNEPGVDFLEGNNGAIGASIAYDEDDYPWLFGHRDLDQGSQGGYFNYVRTDQLEEWEAVDPNDNFSNLGNGFFVPYALATSRVNASTRVITPAWTESTNNFNNIFSGGVAPSQRRDTLSALRNVDIVFTSDKSKWSRCIVIETASFYYQASSTQFPQLDSVYTTEGATPDATKHFDLRYGLSVSKDADSDGNPIVDPNAPHERGMGWFPGYAVDVETGERLNIFFGENSTFSKAVNPAFTGRDMMFNPTDQLSVDPFRFPQEYYEVLLGGQHMVYVANQAYDECEFLWQQFSKNGPQKRNGIALLNWAGILQCAPGFEMNSYADGLIPNDVVVSLRVNNSFKPKNNDAAGIDGNNPRYRFSISGKEAKALDVTNYDAVLDSIKMVPNPYYGYSDYEPAQFTNTVKITNLPGKCKVTIYTIDGKFIRQFTRDEQYSAYNQISPAIEWDLQNSKGIPISSGVYLVNIEAEGLGKRTLKFFAINRKFDPTGL